MKEVYRINSFGVYIEPVHIENDVPCPSDCVEVHPNDPEKGGRFYKHMWIDNHWEEGLSESEITAIQNAPQPLTELEILKKQQADLIFELMMNGVL